VLKPTGRLVFLEPVRGNGIAGLVQDLITPLIRRFGAGCHPNRDTAAAIAAAGFAIETINTRKPWPHLPLVARPSTPDQCVLVPVAVSPARLEDSNPGNVRRRQGQEPSQPGSFWL
jgi:hypothetical protein